jgi:4-hydroxy 2-oxovalerate aldolase
LEYKIEIENYITEYKPFVIALNSSICIRKNLINLYVACNPLTLLSDVKKIKHLKTPLVLPKSILSKSLKMKLSLLKILDYGVGIKENKFDIYEKCSNIPKLYTVAYALSVATSGQPTRILLAGFDGYGSEDRRTKIVDNIFYLYSINKKAKKLLGITPSLYSFDTKSVYALGKI